jgi:DNA-binding GntR family transcriptional regulator
MAKRRSEELRDEIEELIAFGKFPPGKHLDETELAELFGVSRTPVREALNQLANAGLIEIRPRRGAVVAEVGPQRLVEMFEVMAELEGMCGRLAARRLSAAEQKDLLAAQAACKEAKELGDPDLYYLRNDEFHGVIYAGSHNEFLIEQAWALRRRLRPYRRLQLRVRDRMPNSLGEHEAIIAALLAGEGERACELLREHVMVQGKRFADLIASLPLLHQAA